MKQYPNNIVNDIVQTEEHQLPYEPDKKRSFLSKYIHISQSIRKKPELTLLVISILLGILSASMARSSITSKEAELKSTYDTSYILTAAKDLPRGEIIAPSSLREKLVLKSNITPNNATRQTQHLISNKKTLVELKVGDPLLLSTVEDLSDANSLADKIPPGKRLFTLNIKDPTLLNGFIRPNDRVDILAHLDLLDRGITTFTVLQDITVISIGQNSVIDTTTKNVGANISFFIDAKDAEMMAFAQKKGEFTISLRNAEDISKKEVSKGIDLNEFLDYDGISNVSGGGELKVYENGKEVH